MVVVVVVVVAYKSASFGGPFAAPARASPCLRLSYFEFTIYVPIVMTVCVSWISFWLNRKSAPATAMITITTLLAMATNTSRINSSPIGGLYKGKKLRYLIPLNIFITNVSHSVENYKSNCTACSKQ